MIELLAPARNADSGIAAINAGADAVYIGADRFGARRDAGNSVSEIGRLAEYGHHFRARTYLALNTLLYDHEFEEALKIIRAAWNAGIDGLIIQDMGLLECDLPPVPLIASTQTDNRTPEKVRFLEECGFRRAILARELSLEEIHKIRASTEIELEFFVHGALCVSFSGQCYISEALSGRSANRGECAQVCRHKYTLSGKNGEIIKRDQHLLSLRDLNLSGILPELLAAGISSFKIEGRLKDSGYVKNVTAFYRQKIDAILNGDTNLTRTSTGASYYSFSPDPEKSFNRSFTGYFTTSPLSGMSTVYTPKSIGKVVGQVVDTGENWFSLDRQKDLKNGDGLCFFDDQQVLTGFYVNGSQGGRIFPNEMKNIKKGMTLYRNQDTRFEKDLEKEILRKIKVDIELRDDENGFILTFKDEDGYAVTQKFISPKEPALKDGNIESQWKEQLSKFGNTRYEAADIRFNLSGNWFLPISRINGWRRELTTMLDARRTDNYRRQLARIQRNNFPFPEKKLSYNGNVLNSRAISFYQRHGVEEIQQGFELSHIPEAALMTTRFCIKREHGWCPKFNDNTGPEAKGPFYLNAGDKRFRLMFDCIKCEMKVHLDQSTSTGNA